MASSGPNFPATLADDAAAGNTAWATPANAGADDNVYTTTGPKVGQTSHFLNCTNFGFSIPSNATISGIVVTIGRFSATASNNADNNVSLMTNVGGVSTRGGTNKATATVYTTSEVAEDHGANNDLWGLTLAPADVNDSKFGVSVQIKLTGISTATVSIDYVKMTIYYINNQDGALSSAGVASATFVGGGTFPGVLSSAGVGAFTGAGASQADSVITSAGVGAAPFAGTAIIPAVWTSDGVGSFTGGAANTTIDGDISIAGTSTVAFTGSSTADSIISSAGVGATALVGASTADSVVTSAGTGAFSGVLNATGSLVYSIAGIGASAFVSNSFSDGRITIPGVGSANFGFATTADGLFTIAGSSPSSFTGAEYADSIFSFGGVGAFSPFFIVSLTAEGAADVNFVGEAVVSSIFTSDGVGAFSAAMDRFAWDVPSSGSGGWSEAAELSDGWVESSSVAGGWS